MAKFKTPLSNLLITLGVLIIVSVTFLTLSDKILPKTLAQIVLLDNQENSPASPKFLKLHNLTDQIPVLKADYDGKTWQLSEKMAVYVNGSALPGESGNTIIYGHNTDKVLGKLNKMEEGDKISLTMENNRIVSYKVDKKFIVSSTDTSILSQTLTPTLTIFTCDGFLDTHRLVIRASIDKSS